MMDVVLPETAGIAEPHFGTGVRQVKSYSLQLNSA